MAISATYSVGNPTYNITSGGTATATQVITYLMSGDGSSTSFVQAVGGFGLGTPTSVSATITRQQITGVPAFWQKNTTYALNTIVQANGFLQKVTTAGTSMPGWSGNTTFAQNQTICDPYGNMHTCIVGGTTGTSLPTNFSAGMLVGALTQDNGVTWQCTANTCPNFSNVTSNTTTDNTVTWTCQGSDAVVPTYDAPGVTPTLSGTNLTLTFSEALKAPGAQNTDTYGNVFTYTAWAVTVTLTYSAVVNNTLQSQNASWTSATAVNSTVPLTVLGNSTVLCGMTSTGTVTAGTVVFEVSADNTNWFAIAGTLPALFGDSAAWSATASGNQSLQFNVAGYAYFRARLSVVITGSGTVNVQALTSSLQTSTLTTVGQPFGTNNHVTLDDASSGATANLSVKGTQGTNALAVQQFKDSGRTPVVLYLDSLSGITTEALATMNINKGGTTSTATEYTVTTGKTLRIQSILLTVVIPSTTNCASRLRLRSAATVSATSPVFADVVAATQGGAVAFTGGDTNFVIPDGLEFAGGQQVGLSHIESSAIAGSATTGAGISACVVGYEY